MKIQGIENEEKYLVSISYFEKYFPTYFQKYF